MRRRSVLKSVATAAAAAGLTASSARAAGAKGRAPVVETADGTSLFYQDWGSGRPVVFSHGWAAGGDMWEYQMLHLANHGLRCIAHDRRGCGRSSRPGHGYDFDTFADDLAALIDRLELREVTLVGHSMGCGEIARYLSRHGSRRVARVALVATTTPFALKTADNPDGADRAVFDFMVSELAKDRPRYLAAAAPAFFGVGSPNVSVSPETIRWGVDLALRASLKATIDMVRAFSETDFRSDLRAFTMPTLLVHGDADTTAPLASTARKTARAIPESELKVYQGAAHGLFITEKDRFNRDLLAFVNG
jgi:non-heme chloroperoxidase